MRRESCSIEFKPCKMQGFFLWNGATVNKIYECAEAFKSLLETKYCFTIVSNRKLKKIILDFEKEDFRHASGLHYVDDISIEQNPVKLYNTILEGALTDEVLAKSRKYILLNREGGSIQARVEELCELETYLDKSDIIKIYEVQDFGSMIRADYFIEATNLLRKTTVYIFIRKRLERDSYVIVSFFKKTVFYKGKIAYWMMKKKIVNGKEELLYKNSSYIEKDKL